MCGRYATTVNPGLLAAELDAYDETDPLEDLTPEEEGPNFNVAPTTKVVAVVKRHDRADPDAGAALRIRRMRWGLIPRWTKPAEPGVPAKGKPLFNARADTATTTPAFRDAVKTKRCLVPMDGWYEWLTEPGPDGKPAKVPFFMTPADGSRLYMAGLWSVWRDGDRPPLLSCTILTTDSVGELARIHNRMPLIMPSDAWDRWLDPDHADVAGLLESPSEDQVAQLEIRQVSPKVNSVKNNSADLVDRFEPAEQPEQISLL
ncbi:SOS response-associated peptidase [Antrihabitans sp. YC3-6]|uniref:Abasic site processing protein n=1 Tax=Antrihabitans stalagmiti TaxID=2799499 RepID=A0A934U2S7_9NOCA|nr:SOS response-associated peptidase [Antrihabitans stalagmiti]MBJ8338388.1 SOS response-associated peptidase [Antrihabitans stalagmiti]